MIELTRNGKPMPKRTKDIYVNLARGCMIQERRVKVPHEFRGKDRVMSRVVSNTCFFP